MAGGAPIGNGNHYKHGLSHTRIDNIYKGMVSRCYHHQNNRFKNYGAMGVTVCDEWLHDKKTFFSWAFQNGYTDSLTLDRIDVYGDYEPENCRWVSYQEQANNKRNNRVLMIDGISHTMAEWSRISGIKSGTIHSRLKKGWTAKDAVWKAIP
jgi:hypothetical protein